MSSSSGSTQKIDWNALSDDEFTLLIETTPPKTFEPIPLIDHCHYCKSIKDLKLCKSCYNRVYCSAACQKEDWKEHKKECFKIIPIEIQELLPIIATNAFSFRSCYLCPKSAGFRHEVLNDPGSASEPLVAEQIPGAPPGDRAFLVKLGPAIPTAVQYSYSPWDPSESCSANFHEKYSNSTEQFRERCHSPLAKRMAFDGYSLMLHFGAAYIIMSILYNGSKLRLRYGSTFIGNFGIACGSVDVPDNGKLAYILPDGSICKGQDPKEHYWLYFVTQKGEFLYLDLAAYGWNMRRLVMCPPRPWPNAAGNTKRPVTWGPALLVDRLQNEEEYEKYHVKNMWNILSDGRLRAFPMKMESDGLREFPWRVMEWWVHMVLERRMTDDEAAFLHNWLVVGIADTRRDMDKELWKACPIPVKTFEATSRWATDDRWDEMKSKMSPEEARSFTWVRPVGRNIVKVKHGPF